MLLAAALIGLRQMKANVGEKIAGLRQRLGIEVAKAPDPAPRKAARKKRRLSAAGKANIIAALKKRWAERRKQQAQDAAKSTGVRRKTGASRKSGPKKKAAPLAKAARGGRVKSAPKRTTVQNAAPAPAPMPPAGA